MPVCEAPHSKNVSAAIKIFVMFSILPGRVISFGDYFSRHFG